MSADSGIPWEPGCVPKRLSGLWHRGPRPRQCRLGSSTVVRALANDGGRNRGEGDRKLGFHHSPPLCVSDALASKGATYK